MRSEVSFSAPLSSKINWSPGLWIEKTTRTFKSKSPKNVHFFHPQLTECWGVAHDIRHRRSTADESPVENRESSPFPGDQMHGLEETFPKSEPQKHDWTNTTRQQGNLDVTYCMIVVCHRGKSRRLWTKFAAQKTQTNFGKKSWKIKLGKIRVLPCSLSRSIDWLIAWADRTVVSLAHSHIHPLYWPPILLPVFRPFFCDLFFWSIFFLFESIAENSLACKQVIVIGKYKVAQTAGDKTHGTSRRRHQ